MLFETGSKSLLFLNFELHRDYFAKELCVKKDVPGNCCQGSCQLTKEIKEQDAREKQQAPLSTVKSEVSVFEMPACELAFFKNFQLLLEIQKTNMISLGFYGEILRPPIG